MNSTGMQNIGKTERMTRMGLLTEPAGYVDGQNLYEFVMSSPILDADPMGLGTYREGSPQRPPINWDNGFQYNPNASSSASDWAAWYKYGALLTGAEGLGHIPDATRAYAHYRGATGSDLWVDYNKAYNEDSDIKSGVDGEIRSAQLEAERLHAHLKKDRFDMTGSAVGVQSATENWQKALGGHDIWGSGPVSFDCKTNSYTMALTLTMEDFYNFNKGQSDIATGLPDDENGRFEVFGWAKSFYSRGSLTRTVTWKAGNVDGADASDPSGRGSRDRGWGRDRDRDRRDRGRGSGRYGS